ncbi:MAG: hypothetical protein AAB389_01965 [Patescibacteria group bacterium]|mgnify:FL=1
MSGYCLNDSLDGAAKFLPVLYKLIDLTAERVIKWDIEPYAKGIHARLNQKHRFFFDGKLISIVVIQRREKNGAFALQVTQQVPFTSGGGLFDQILFIVDDQSPVRDLVRGIERAMLCDFSKKLESLGAGADISSEEKDAYRSADELLKQLNGMQKS